MPPRRRGFGWVLGAGVAAGGAAAAYAAYTAFARRPTGQEVLPPPGPNPSAHTLTTAARSQKAIGWLTQSCEYWERCLHDALAKGDGESAAWLRDVLERAYGTLEAARGPDAARRQPTLLTAEALARLREGGNDDAESYHSACADLGGRGGGTAEGGGVSPSSRRLRTVSETSRRSAGRDLWAHAQELAAAGRVVLRHPDRTAYVGGSAGPDHAARVHCFREASALIMQRPEQRKLIEGFASRILCGIIIKGGGQPEKYTEAMARLTGFFDEAQAADGLASVSEEILALGVPFVTLYDVVFDFLLFDALEMLEDPPSAVLSVVQNGWIPSSVRLVSLKSAVWAAIKARKAVFPATSFMRQMYEVNETYLPTLACGLLGVGDAKFVALADGFIALVKEWMTALFAIPGTVPNMTAEEYASKILETTTRMAPRGIDLVSSSLGDA